MPSPEYVSLDLDYEVDLIELDPTVPSIEVAFTTGALTRIKRWNGSAWVEVLPGTIYIVRAGDPTPPLVANDVVLTENV